MSVSSEDGQVVDLKVTPQSCHLTIAKTTPETSPNEPVDTPQKSIPNTAAEQDGKESSSSRNSGRSKKQTQLYGSPIHHVVKEVSDASVPGFSGVITDPVSAEELLSSPYPRRKMKVFEKNTKIKSQKKEK